MAIGTDARVREVVSDVVAHERRDALLGLRRPALRIARGESVDAGAPVSRLGGRPLAAPGATWPVAEDGPLDLLAQIDLAEVARLMPDGPLPDHGLLSFFCDINEPPWTFMASDPAKWQVRWDQGEVEPMPFPEDGWPVLPAYGMRWEPATTLPRAAEDDIVFQNLGLTSELAAVNDALGDGPAFHQLLGWPHLLRGSTTTQCQREMAFMVEDRQQYAPNVNLSEHDWDTLDEATLASDWRLLLQLGPDNGWNREGGDALYFCVRADDLAKHNFERVWTVVHR
ncbi:DUF1963 domain-containing protein [Yinghuangia sp. ASG 101]|uniref:DUF1963 domain-containing protein n=1 Tax=Yinghuangia sp. ASG 101 TaxID=2896848 RepID=UPI001E3DDD83|nr:YwqG family protein [Yinghuangia sp. ASG 101]UGQ11955.1 DUF1963 domain-containing protein [Yinghuangia sp. ASG 101]